MNLKKWLNLENLIYFIIFSLPLYLIKVKIYIVPTNMLEILVGGLFFLGLFGKNKEYNIREVFFQFRKFLIPLSLILLGLIISALLNGGQNVSWGIIKGWFFIPLIFAFLIIEIIPVQKIRNIYQSYFFGVSLVSIIALGYLFLGKLTYDGRLTAFFNSANYLAMYLAPAIIIGFIQVFHLENKNSNNQKFVNVFCLSIILGAFYYTYSYATWFSVLVTVLILLGIKYKKSNGDSLLQILKNKKILFILFLFGIIVFFQFKNEKFVDLVNLNERSSLSSRIMIWKSAARMIEDNFWWGIGAGNFQEKYLEYQKYYPLYLEWAVPHPHSLYLTFWLYGGIIGLTGFLALIFQYSKGMFRMIKKEKDNELILVSLGIMLVILIHGFIDTTYFKNDLAIVFWSSFLVFKNVK